MTKKKLTQLIDDLIRHIDDNGKPLCNAKARGEDLALVDDAAFSTCKPCVEKSLAFDLVPLLVEVQRLN